MSDAENTPQPQGTASPDQIQSAMFASLIMQQSNMAMMFMGKMPNPETGDAKQDLNAARMFIDMLDMLAVKTKGNLSQDESKMLTDSLTGLRMAFVECVNEAKAKANPAQTQDAKPSPSPSAPPAADPKSAPAPSTTPEPPAAKDETPPKKYTKKY